MSDDAQAHRTRALVSTAYGVALDPTRFDDLLSSWDDWFLSAGDAQLSSFPEVSADFEGALQVSARLGSVGPDLNALDLLSSAAILIDESRTVLSMNGSAMSLFDEGELSLADVVQEHNIASGLSRVGGGAGRRSYLAMEAPVSAAIISDYPDAHSMVLISSMVWTDSFETELADRLGLSAAELKVARGLLHGRTAQEIAGDVGRSLPTIRSHIKVMLEKTGARRQTELVQLLTILHQTFEVAKAGSEVRDGPSGYSTTLLTGPAGKLEVIQYGAGQPLLYFTTSSCPWENAAVRDAFVAAGFRVIAPARPGFGNSSRSKGNASEMLLDCWFDGLMEASGQSPVFAGHREGGILAAHAACRALNEDLPVAGLAMISTGAPVRSLSQFDTAPKTTRRSLVAGQLAKPALTLGYEAAARYFKTGPAGEEKFVRYFCRENEADKLLLSDPVMFQTIRDNLSFCFEHPAQIARDVGAWGTDWSSALKTVASRAPVLFAHGSKHDFFSIDDVRQVCASQKAMSLLPLDGTGQLALYVEPGRIATACRNHFGRGKDRLNLAKPNWPADEP